jgi:hypothetical protein
MHFQAARQIQAPQLHIFPDRKITQKGISRGMRFSKLPHALLLLLLLLHARSKALPAARHSAKLAHAKIAHTRAAATAATVARPNLCSGLLCSRLGPARCEMHKVRNPTTTPFFLSQQ